MRTTHRTQSGTTTDNAGAAGTAAYYLADGLGSTTQLTDAGGSVTDTYTYDVFGALRSSSGSTTNPVGFAGQQTDHTANRGLQYLRARHYDPALGRFLGRDPVPFPQRYAYAGGDPVNLTDPSGAVSLETGGIEVRVDCIGGPTLSFGHWGIEGPFPPLINFGGYVACSLHNVPFPTEMTVYAYLMRIDIIGDQWIWSSVDYVQSGPECTFSWICQPHKQYIVTEPGIYAVVADVACGGCNPIGEQWTKPLVVSSSMIP